MARSKKQLRRQTAKPPWPDAEVDESPFARVTADMVTRGQFNLASSQVDDELQRSRFLASTAGLLVYKGEAAPSPIGPSSKGSALAEAMAARVLADEEVHRLREELAALKTAHAHHTGEATHEEGAQIRGLRDELAALKATLAEQESALAQATQSSQTDADSREQTAQALADMRAQGEAAREEADAQVRDLRDDLAALRSTLAERETALAQMAEDHEKARATWKHESQDSLSNTEQEWKDAEAARFAEAEAKWREQSQKLLAELHAQAEAAHDQAERDIKTLRDEVAALRLSLKDREASFAKATSDHDQARAHWQQESHTALSNAEQAWKTAEATRLAGAEAKWREQSTQALAALRAESDKARESAEETIRGLQDQMSAIQSTLAERDTALAEAAVETQRARDQARQELDTVLAKAKAWQAEEAQRLAAAEAKWKQQSSAALAEAQARYQAAEGALVTVRLEADRARSNATGGSINAPKSGDRSVFGTKAAAREPEPVAIRLPTREARGQAKQEQIVLQPHRMLEDPHAPKKRGLGRDLLVVAALAVVVIVAYPRIEPLIPEPWRSNIAALTGGFKSSASVAAQGSAVVARDVNLRVGPSTTANIISTLPQGLNVATLARRDEWTFVEVGADSRNPQPRRGWVFSSFLKEGTADAEDEDGAQSEDSE
jgi:Bacterial SH3 domain